MAIGPKEGSTAGPRALRRLALAAAIYGCWCLPPFGDGPPLGSGIVPMAWAQPKEEEPRWLPGPPTEEMEIEVEDLDEAHEAVSEAFLATADWLDSFFGDPRIREEANRTRVKVGFFSGVKAHDGFGFDLDTDLRIVLPRTKERLQFLVFGDSDDEFDTTTTWDTTRRRDDTVGDGDDSSLTTALQYFFRATDRRNISLKVGLRFRDLRPVVFTGPRYRESFDLDPWTVRFTGSLRWFSDEGLESRAIVDVERQLFDGLLLRVTPEASWFQDEEGLFYGLDVRLFQPLGVRRALEYEWINRFQTQPNNRLERSTARVRYRQTLWRDWLVAEVAPELALPRDENYRPAPGLVFGLGVIFGYYDVDG